MNILRLDLEGFRSFRAQTWCPGRLNVIIGPNASGKSNLLRALELLQIAAKGKLGTHVQREGGMQPIVWDGQAESVSFRARMSPLPPYENSQTDALTYQLTLGRLGMSGSYRIDHEVLGNFCGVDLKEQQHPSLLLYRDPHKAFVHSMESHQFTSSIRTTTTTTPDPTGRNPVQVMEDSLPEEETLLSYAAGPFAVNKFAADFQEQLVGWKIYQGIRTDRDAAIRAPQITRVETQVDADGQNLISVLHTLYTGDKSFRTEIDSAMQAAFGDDFEELVFPPASDQRTQLRIRWRSLQNEQPAANLSDGTLRFLFLLAVLANPKPAPLIAIDEPETGLHPSMLPIVTEYAREVSNRSQVILTTHSPEFLNAFGDCTPTTTVVEWRNGETQLRVLPQEELGYWLKKFSLGELYRSQQLEAMP